MKSPTCIKTGLLILFLFAAGLAQDTVSASPSADSLKTIAPLSRDTVAAAPSTAQDSAFISMTGDCRYPAVTTEGKTIYMTWIVIEGRPAHLYFKKSTDEGKLWTSSVMISNDNSDCLPPAIAVHSGAVHVAWVDLAETIDGEIYYTRSLDDGKTWEKSDILVANANSARYPLLYTNGNDVYLIWQDVENQVYFKASHDQGKTWGNELLLGKVGKHSCYCYPPALSVTGKELVIVWTDYRESNKGVSVRFSGFPLFRSQKGKMVSSVVCRISRDGGRTWGKDKVLTSTTVSAETKDEIDNPTMLSDGSLSYCFWLDKRDLPLGEIYYARFDPARDKFPVSGKPLFSGEKRSPKRPSATFDEKGNVHMSWASFFQGLSTLSYGAIDPQGNILKERKELTAVIGRFHNPIITRTPSGLMYVFWFDEPKDKEKWSRIFLKTSKDNGATWADWEPLKKDIQQ